MGVNIDRVIQVTFLIGGVMAGAAATLYMIKIGVTPFDAGFILGVKAFTAAVLGGIGNLRGALLGGLRPRPRRELRLGPHRRPVEGRRRVRRCWSSILLVPADRPAGRVAGEGTRMIARPRPTEPAAARASRLRVPSLLRLPVLRR